MELKDTHEITHERLFRHVQYFAEVSPLTMNIDFERVAMKCGTAFFSFVFLKSERKSPPLENGRQVG